ncbi:MAG: hypothetical protein ABSH11_11070 [Verrucomicrobiota bacterium]|jgi:hypothetical protein
MGKQSNKVENRKRRNRYLKRKKMAAKMKKAALKKANRGESKEPNWQAA